MKKSFFMFLLFLLCLGCKDDSKNFYLAKTPTDLYTKRETIESIRFIENRLNKRILLKPGNYPIFVSLEKIIADEISSEDDYAYAIMASKYCHIVMNKNVPWDKEKYRLVLFHEIGHCLGLNHPIEDFGSIMDSCLSDQATEINSLPNFIKTIDGLTSGYRTFYFRDIFKLNIIHPLNALYDPFLRPFD